MRLITSLMDHIKWDKLLTWNILVASLFLFRFLEGNIELYLIFSAAIGILFLNIMIVLMIWNEVLYGRMETLPILSMWYYVIIDIKIAKNDPRTLLITEWCRENCRGKWIHDKQGYFSFKRKIDAVGFKLRWI